MPARIGLITLAMSGLWVWASVLEAHGHNDDGFDRVPLFMEMRDAALEHASANASAHEGAPSFASKASINQHAAAD